MDTRSLSSSTSPSLTVTLPRKALCAFATMALVLTVSVDLSAQNLMGYDGGGAAVFEFNGPPAGACAYPTGPVVGGFPTAVPHPCPTVGPTAPAPGGFLGGMANDALTDTVYVTDGAVITSYAPGGAPIASFPAPPVLAPGITAIAFDSVAGTLYITDGFACVGVVPPPAPGCAVPLVVVPAFPIGAGAGAPVTGLTFHPPSGTLFSIDAGGLIMTTPPGGPGAIAWAAIPDLTCGALGGFGPIQSIAFDRATPGAVNPDSFYITDGMFIVYANMGGPPALPAFYSPVPCFPVPGPPINGMISTSRPVNFGMGTDPTGLVPPVFVQAGQFTSPSGPLFVGIAGADPTPGTIAGLIYNFGPVPFGGAQLCPPVIAFTGNGFLLGAPFFGPLGGVTPLAGGAGGIPAALPAGLPLGIEVNFQWIVKKGSGGFQVSDGMSFSIGLP